MFLRIVSFVSLSVRLFNRYYQTAGFRVISYSLYRHITCLVKNGELLIFYMKT